MSRLVTYTYRRSLELAGDPPKDTGGWPIMPMRLYYGEGVPDEQDLAIYPELDDNSEPFKPSPEIPEYILRKGRISAYYRIRNEQDCIEALKSRMYTVTFAFNLTTDWANPAHGILPSNNSDETDHAHCIAITNWLPKYSKYFQIQNSWGAEWGNAGHALMPTYYFDKYIIEAWTQEVSLTSRTRIKNKQIDKDTHVTAISTYAHSDQKLYWFNIAIPGGNDRAGWAYAIEYNNTLNIEDIYIHPQHRRKGYANILIHELLDLKAAKGMPLALWVPYADSCSQNRNSIYTLPKIAERLGLTYRQSPVRWAAYLATEEQNGSLLPIEPHRMPNRPQSTIDTLKKATAAVMLGITTATPPSGQIDTEQVNYSEVARASLLSEEEWNELCTKREALIYKNVYESITEEESRELDELNALHLQKLSEHDKELRSRIDAIDQILNSPQPPNG